MNSSFFFFILENEGLRTRIKKKNEGGIRRQETDSGACGEILGDLLQEVAVAITNGPKPG